MIIILKYVIGILLGIPILMFLTYLLSSMQMAAWMDTFNRKTKIQKSNEENSKKE